MATREQRTRRRGIGGAKPSSLAALKPGENHMAEANALVNGDRQAAYGSPLQSYEAQAKVWSGILADKLTSDLTAEEVVLLLAAMKLRRQAHKPKRDNVVDTHGYLLVLAHVEEGRKSHEPNTRPKVAVTDLR
jgi:hypothetical protein